MFARLTIYSQDKKEIIRRTLFSNIGITDQPERNERTDRGQEISEPERSTYLFSLILHAYILNRAWQEQDIEKKDKRTLRKLTMKTSIPRSVVKLREHKTSKNTQKKPNSINA